MGRTGRREEGTRKDGKDRKERSPPVLLEGFAAPAFVP
jgi:hypothetical protein